MNRIYLFWVCLYQFTKFIIDWVIGVLIIKYFNSVIAKFLISTNLKYAVYVFQKKLFVTLYYAKSCKNSDIIYFNSFFF